VPTDPTTRVDDQALVQAAHQLRVAGARIGTERDELHRAAIAPLFAIPPGDLNRSYVFAWGRWSSVLDDTYEAAVALADAVDCAAARYAAAEQVVHRSWAPR
jgi:hypothetical protein